MNKKLILTALAVAIVVILVIWANSKPNTTGVVRIGAVFPLTGGLAIYGEPGQKAAQMAMEDINASGGIDGKQLEIIYEDHKCDPKTAVAAFEKLSAQGVKVFSSLACSGTVLALAPKLSSGNAVLLGTTVTTPKISGVSPYIFRNWASDIQESKLFAEQIQKSGYKKVGAIYEQTDYAQGIVLNLQEFLKEKGIEFVGESFASGTTDVRSQLTKLQAANVDVILVSVQTVTSGEVVLKQMEQLGLKTKLFITDNIVAVPQLIAAHSELLEGAFGAQYILSSPEQASELLAKYKAKYGADCPQPTVCTSVYDAVQMLAQAIDSKDYNAQEIAQYLSKISYKGTSGTISFNHNHDRNWATYSLFVIKSGQAMLTQ